jgi:hypothetical protein
MFLASLLAPVVVLVSKYSLKQACVSGFPMLLLQVCHDRLLSGDVRVVISGFSYTAAEQDYC